jgi:outer membrane protein assembly factor BamB
MRAILTATAILWGSVVARADDWPQFRGPTGLGYTTEKTLPVKWGGESAENVLWKSPLVGEGHASPIVVGGKVVLSTVLWPGGKRDPKVMPEHHVVAYSAAEGKVLWDTKIEPGPWLREDFRSGAGGGYAAPTPASDGKHIVVVFGSSVMASLDLDGKVAWRQEIRPHSFDVTIGSSPILYENSILFLCAMAKASDSRLAAFSKTDGQLQWEAKLPKIGFGHSTPLLLQVKGKPQVIVLASAAGPNGEAIQSFNPADGKRLWWCKSAGDASSPAYGSGILYTDSGRGGNGTAVDPTGEGDVSATHVRWTVNGLPESIGSPIIVGDRVFRLQGSGIVRIWNAADGTETDRSRLEGIGSTWASPIADPEGRIFFANGGKSYVVKAGPKLEILSMNDLGDANHSSAAVSKGRLFISGMKNLYCIGSK